MSLTRRIFVAGLAAGALAPAAGAHTMYRQWVVYRQKHLLIGCHRKDLGTWEQALLLSESLGHLLPEAAARAARAPHPERLASLLATRQLDLAVLAPETAEAMQSGSGGFAAYGPVPLTAIADMGGYLLAAHADFTAHHGWLLAAALDEEGARLGNPALPMHSGVAAYLAGEPMETLLPG